MEGYRSPTTTMRCAMRNRTFLLNLTVWLWLLGLPGLVMGQTQSDSNARTSWGDPNLQGTWSYASLTPLQRPTSLGEREYYSEEEAAERNIAVTRDVAPPPGSVGSYNALWFDRGSVSPDLRTSLITEPTNGRLPVRPETTAKAAAARAYTADHPADSWLDRSNWDRCITYHGVPPVSTGYNNTYQIFQTPDYVAILVENIHDVRVIPLDGRPQLTSEIRQWNGDSRGRWEGDTLVVETRNFSDQTQHRFPSSPDTVAVERFRRLDDNTLKHTFTIEDNAVYTQPWTGMRHMPRLSEYIIYEYACHEGNYAMTNILSAERTREANATNEL